MNGHRQGEYRFIEHTADVGIEVFSPTLEGVFETAGAALFDLIAPIAPGAAATPGAAAPADGPTVEAEGEEPEVLLVNLLNDLLLLFDTEGLLFRSLKTRSLEGGRIVLDTCCEPLDPGGEGVETVVKAATFHDVTLEKTGGRWHALVYLDL